MRKEIQILLVALLPFVCVAQDITGQWNGILKAGETQLRMVIHITKSTNGTYSAVMDSPDQGAKGIPVASTGFDDLILKLEIAPGVQYEGTLNNGTTFKGVFQQGGNSIPLNFSREIPKKEKNTRPQEPIAPFPYYTEDVVFENTTDKIQLYGTLTLPNQNGDFPVAILISGSGPQDRNSEIFNHKPFLVLADYLTKNGIAVLRVDDRGTGKSTGIYNTAGIDEFKRDTQFAVAYLKTRKEINTSKIGLIGHSLGGVIAPIIASESKNIDFIILLAGSGIRGDKLMLLQKEMIERSMGVSEEGILVGQKNIGGAYDIILNATSDANSLKDDLKKHFKNVFGGAMSEQEIEALSAQLTIPWLTDFIRFDPKTALEKLECPVLALNGSNDLQVPAKVNLEAIKSIISKNKNSDIRTVELPELNHLFQKSVTGLPNEYGLIEQTFSPKALQIITDWILEKTK